MAKRKSKKSVDAAVYSDRYTYRIQWSDEDEEFVALCAEFPLLSWLDKDAQKALRGIRKVALDVVFDRMKRGLDVPEPLVTRNYSGVFKVRVPPDVHRKLTVEAAEADISINRLVSAKLAS